MMKIEAAFFIVPAVRNLCLRLIQNLILGLGGQVSMRQLMPIPSQNTPIENSL